MGYMNEFPHSRMFDSDLREILNMYFKLNDLPSSWEDFKTMMGNDWADLKNFVNNYFTDLDVQTEINNKIDAMVASGDFVRALAPYFKVLEARMDTFTRLEDGASTGDAELTDARVDFKGNTHSNIGAHIREVSSQLSSEIAFLGRVSCIYELVNSFVNKAYSIDRQELYESKVHLISEAIGVAENDLFFKVASGYVARIVFFDENGVGLMHTDYLTSGKIIEGQRFRIIIKKEIETNITVEERNVIFDDIHSAIDNAKRYASSCVVDNPNNLFSLEDGWANLIDVESNTRCYFYIKHNRIYVTTLGANAWAVRLKLTNGYEVKKSGNEAVDLANWKAESVPQLLKGKTYCADYTYEDNSAGIVISVRDANAASILKEGDSAITLSTDAAYICVYVPNGVSLFNSECSLFIEESNALTGKAMLDKNIHIPKLKYLETQLQEVVVADKSYYSTVETFVHEVIHEDVLNRYGAVQGMCSDGNYLYYSTVSQSDADNTLLTKYSIKDDSVVLTKQNRSYGHANALAYIPNENVLYVCNLSPRKGVITKVNADTLEYDSEFTLDDSISDILSQYVDVGAVAYDSTKEKIIFLLRGSVDSDNKRKKAFAIFDKNMIFEKLVKTEPIECESFSGICTDENFIYLTHTNPLNPTIGEWLVAYDWHGNEVFKTQLYNYTHVEAQAKIGDTFYFADNRTLKGATIVKATVSKIGLISKIDVLSKYNLN